MNSIACTVPRDELITAYELFIDCLPKRELWFSAVSRRTDVESPEAVFRAIDAVRSEALARIGDIAAGQPVSADWPVAPCGANPGDTLVALQMIVVFLPDPSLSRMMVMLRCDGGSPSGVFAGIADIRRMIEARIRLISPFPATVPMRAPSRA